MLANEQAGYSSDVVWRKHRTCTTLTVGWGFSFFWYCLTMTSPSESEIITLKLIKKEDSDPGFCAPPDRGNPVLYGFLFFIRTNRGCASESGTHR